jgi:mRNA-degrading endonuclease YafQ of YafQ-DinJ toxin-antitoxin module
MFKIKTTNQFEKDSVRCIKRNYDFTLLQKSILLLEETGNLPSQY